MTLNQTGQVIRWLEDKFYAEHFSIYDLSDPEDVYRRVSKMSEKQYEYLKILLNQKRWFSIKSMFSKYLIIK